MIDSNIKTITMCALILLCGVGICCAQAPVIIPNAQPINLTLDDQGNLTVTPGQVCTIQPDALNSTPTVTLVPSYFNCFSTGRQTVNITASDQNLAVTFNQPIGLVFDAAGNLYIADAGNHKIRKIAVDGTVSDFAGDGSVGVTDGPGNVAQFDTPEGIAIDNAGNFYVTDARSGLIRKITPAGIVSTIAGTAYSIANDNGSGFGVSFDQPYGIAVDSHNNIYIADATASKIRKLTPGGQVTTFAGSSQGFADGKGTAALFFIPAGVAVDAHDNVFVADTYNNRIRKITPDGSVQTVAGNSQAGIFDAVGVNANFNHPYNLTIDAAGNIYVADTQNQDIRKLDQNYSVTTIAGNNKIGSKDGYINDNAFTKIAQFNSPEGLAIDNAGDLFVGDVFNNEIREITGNYITTYAGNGIAGNDNGDLNYYKKHTSAASVSVVVNPYLKITSVYPDVPLASCIAAMPDFTSPLPLVKDNCNDNIVATQSPVAGTPLSENSVIPVTLTVEDALQQYDHVTFNVITKHIDPVPAVTITPSTTAAVCANTPVSFIAVTQNATAPAYQWLVNGLLKSSSGPEFTGTFVNGDVVTCNIISSSCSAPASSSPFIANVAALPTVTFTGSPVIRNGSSVQLNPQVSGNISAYKWTPPDGLSSDDIPNPIAKPQKNTIYRLTVTTAQGCTAGGTVKVTVIDNLSVPTAFTPNGDNLNDVWDIPGLTLYPNCVVNVYNRYGTLVYHSVGYARPWDGTTGGNQLPAGTYYYVIDLKTLAPPFSGPVTIIK